jgi:2-dehydro-3-deoxyphosphogluconate aldolase / (4S)-4-hydroxy-2-oxoglutarate aldolase
MTEIDVLRTDRVLSVVRAERIPDAADRCHTLAAGGIHTVELTFTTPGVLDHVRSCADAVARSGVVLGVGTVLTADQAAAAIDAGARFLVTPGIRPDAAAVAVANSVPVFLGAFTPTEVAEAVDLGSRVVKIFPASSLGPKYPSDLHGPYPASSSCHPAAAALTTPARTSTPARSRSARAPASFHRPG